MWMKTYSYLPFLLLSSVVGVGRMLIVSWIQSGSSDIAIDVIGGQLKRLLRF